MHKVNIVGDILIVLFTDSAEMSVSILCIGVMIYFVNAMFGYFVSFFGEFNVVLSGTFSILPK